MEVDSLKAKGNPAFTSREGAMRRRNEKVLTSSGHQIRWSEKNTHAQLGLECMCIDS